MKATTIKKRLAKELKHCNLTEYKMILESVCTVRVIGTPEIIEFVNLLTNDHIKGAYVSHTDNNSYSWVSDNKTIIGSIQ